MEELKLRRYQKNGIKWLVHNFLSRKSLLLADEMGTGKTVHSIKVAELLKRKKILYVTPASTRLKIEREWRKWSSYSVGCVKTGKDVVKNADKDVQIVSYSLLKEYKKQSFDFIVFDEAHKLKSPNTARTRAARAVRANSDLALYMTGTPGPNGLIDSYYLLKAVAPDKFTTKEDFGNRYCLTRYNPFSKHGEFYGHNPKTMHFLHYILRDFMLRRKKDEVVKDLPPKTFEAVPVEIKGASKFVLDERGAQQIIEDMREGRGLRVGETVVATKVREIGTRKIKPGIEYISDLMEEKDRLVVFTYHNDVNTILTDSLNRKYKKTIAYSITGKTSHGKRDDIIQDFQNNKDHKMILVAQVEAAGIGIELTAADTCLFFELDYRPHVMLQAMDRLHRIGQESSVSVQYFIARKTIDEQIIVALRDKLESSIQSFDNGRIVNEV